ncbi:MAG: phosphoenolpyruvate--protein phosphotransferase [Candidatus Omnitrophica bacterium]|nr:phosphoenolpyruvate--protein phosphotransferase [Candidatus Omnitrophota bacterium]
MIPRDHTKLICDIGELSGLFSDTSSLDGFLQKIVEMISSHMHSEVCSIYIYYENTNELVLRATKGLKPEAIGKVTMKLGEGLTGIALKELRPVCEKNASKTPGYRYFPDIGEELYESFLAVPIVRGTNRIGAVVIQNSQKNYFNEEDTKVFRAITSQLANTIETAKLLISFNEKASPAASPTVAKELKFIKGRVGCEGFSFAEAIVHEQSVDLAPPEEQMTIAQARLTLEDFHRAVQETEKQLEALQEQIEEKLSDVASLIFTAQILMLKDQSFLDAIVKAIGEGLNPPDAVRKVASQYATMFDALPNQYLRDKKHDVLDIGSRLLENLIGVGDAHHDLKGKIVISRQLFPSDILKFSSLNVSGVILLSGGVASHLTILAVSLGLPVVFCEEPQLLKIPQGTKVILDADNGNIYVSPTQEVIESFKNKEKDRLLAIQVKHEMKDMTVTSDGERVRLMANINLLGDLSAAREYRAEGIGLYRTEFPFIVRSDFPSEEEQLSIYTKLVQGMPGQEITFRTLDIGGDKVLSYYDNGNEENPFLGMRSIRFSLRHKDVFAQQIRAILRAGVGANIRMMFPMISSLDEFIEAKDFVRQCADELSKEGVPHHANPPIGMMVELPSVIEIIDELAQEADFFSIGTNDFIQYMLAVDRTNEKVADFFLPHHPGVLRALYKVACAAKRHGKDVSVCGLMSHQEKFVPYLLGIGIRKLSVDSRYLYKIQRAVECVSLKEAEAETKKILSTKLVRDIERLLK